MKSLRESQSMRKNAMVGLVMVAVMGPVGIASAATAYDFVIFHNNSSSEWVRVSESLINADGWVTAQPSVNPAGGTKSGYYKTQSGRTTYYSATWQDTSDGTSCTFNSRSY